MVEFSPIEHSRRRRAGFPAIVALGVALVVTVAGGVLVVGGLTGGTEAQAAPAGVVVSGANQGRAQSGAAHRVSPGAGPTAVPTTTVVTAPVAPTPTTTTPASVAVAVPVPTTAGATPATTVPGSTNAEVAALVAQVEASGIDPGPTWTWSIGDTSVCGAIPGSNIGTGCTSGAAGAVTTVFAGTPGLLLVAHELANAETENYAVPNLVALVAGSAGGASWSAIDAVASCLVVHFMHVQDGAAGPWACPGALADTVGAAIHDPAFTA